MPTLCIAEEYERPKILGKWFHSSKMKENHFLHFGAKFVSEYNTKFYN